MGTAEITLTLLDNTDLAREPDELRALIEAARSGNCSWDVVADWMEERGDPRGEHLRIFLSAPKDLAKIMREALVNLQPAMKAFGEVMRRVIEGLGEAIGMFATNSGRIAAFGPRSGTSGTVFFGADHAHGFDVTKWHAVPLPLVTGEQRRGLQKLVKEADRYRKKDISDESRHVQKRQHQERLKHSQPWRRR